MHIGQKLDSRAHFAGAIDDVRVYDRALSDTELHEVNSRGSATRDTVLWLPMDRVRGSN